MKKYTKEIVLAALGLALVFAATLFIKFPTTLGYFNLGDAVILSFSSILNPGYSFLIGGVGSALADLSAGFPEYAVFTLIIKGIEGAFASYFLFQKNEKARVFVYCGAIAIIVGGYFVADWILTGSVVAALPGVTTNFLQGLCGVTAAFILTPKIKKMATSYRR